VRRHSFRELCRFKLDTVALRFSFELSRQLALHAEKAVLRRRGLSLVIHDLIGSIDFDGKELKITFRTGRGSWVTPVEYMKGTVSRYSRIEAYTDPAEREAIIKGLREVEGGGSEG